jgi:hypothetical protein
VIVRSATPREVLRQRAEIEARVELARAHLLERIVRHDLVEVELDGRMTLERARDQIANLEERGIEHRPEPQPPGQLLGKLARGLPQALHVADDGFGVGEQSLARRRQQHPRWRALEQRHAEIALERLDLARDGRLAEVHRLGGTRQVAELGHRHEGLELGQVHGGRALRGRFCAPHQELGPIVQPDWGHPN